LPDNVELDAGAGGAVIAADEATYSGDTTQVQLVRLVHVSGAEGAKTVNEVFFAEDSAHSSAHYGLQTFSVRADTAAALGQSDGDYQPLVTDSTGRLWCNVSNTVTVASHAVTNAGTFVVQENGAALTALQVIDNPVFVDDAAFTVGTSSVNVVGFLADQASTDSVNEGDVGAARMTLDRKIVTTIAPSADTEGWDVANNIDVDETEDAVKASAGKLGGYYWYNDGASEVYIKYYNDTVANVIVGTTAPFMTIALPAGAAANVEWTNGIAFSAAITVAATTGAATADTGAPAANQVVGFSLYK
jgi:hypothetical protein